MGMPATTTRETQRSNGMKNVTFISDKTIWDAGGQQIDGRRWQEQQRLGDVCAGGG